MPELKKLLQGPLVLDTAERWNGLLTVDGHSVLLRALDACLGVPGLPQSALTLDPERVDDRILQIENWNVNISNFDVR